MKSILTGLNLTGLLSALVKLGVNVTGKQYEYLKWRLSDEGKKHFNQKADNRFYRALEKGDTTVMDLEIKQRQKEIDGLLGELGPLCIVIGLLFLTGCSNITIPTERPMAHPESLMMNERSYVVENMEVKTPKDGELTLDGKWHVVSADFIRQHRENQDNLLAALKHIKKNRTRSKFKLGAALAAAVVAFVLGYKLGVGRIT